VTHQLWVLAAGEDVAVLTGVLLAGALQPGGRLEGRGWRGRRGGHLLLGGRDGLLEPKAQDGLTVVVWKDTLVV